MNQGIFIKINELIDQKQIEKAQLELSKIHNQQQRNPEYLFLRSKIFYLSKLYYLAIDTLLVSLEFEESDKVYSLLGEIYGLLGNNNLSNKILDKNLRVPPGIHAELGYRLAEINEMDQARMQLNNESAIYPESKTFINSTN